VQSEYRANAAIQVDVKKKFYSFGKVFDLDPYQK